MVVSGMFSILKSKRYKKHIQVRRQGVPFGKTALSINTSSVLKMLNINSVNESVILRSKKGFFFTILAIMLVSVFIVVFTSTSTLREQRQFSSAQTEALLLNSFTEQLEEEYLATAMKIAGVNAINAMTAYVNQTPPIPVTNPEQAFSLAANNGGYITPVEINPASQPLSNADLIFHMVFANQSSPASMEVSNLGSPVNSVFFGDTMGVRQQFYINTTSWLRSLDIPITNESATSNYLVALLYEGDNLVGFADTYFNNARTEFIFNELVTLDPSTIHYFYIFAPYDPSASAYSIGYLDGTTYSCDMMYDSLCNADTVAYNTPTAGTMTLPLDLQLNEPIIRGGSFQSLIRSLELLALTDINLILEVNVSDFEIDQDESPWTIDVAGNFNITTRHTTVSFSKDKHMEVNISIIGAYDPLSFFLFDETGGTLPIRTINASNITLWTEPNAFTEQYNSGTYIHHPATTKYLDRFSNDRTSSACCGIAYIVPDTLADFSKMYLDDSYLGGLICDGDTPHYKLTGFSPAFSADFKFTLELIEFFGLDNNAIIHECSVPSEP